MPTMEEIMALAKKRKAGQLGGVQGMLPRIPVADALGGLPEPVVPTTSNMPLPQSVAPVAPPAQPYGMANYLREQQVGPPLVSQRPTPEAPPLVPAGPGPAAQFVPGPAQLPQLAAPVTPGWRKRGLMDLASFQDGNRAAVANMRPSVATPAPMPVSPLVKQDPATVLPALRTGSAYPGSPWETGRQPDERDVAMQIQAQNAKRYDADRLANPVHPANRVLNQDGTYSQFASPQGAMAAVQQGGGYAGPTLQAAMNGPQPPPSFQSSLTPEGLAELRRVGRQAQGLPVMPGAAQPAAPQPQGLAATMQPPANPNAPPMYSDFKMPYGGFEKGKGDYYSEDPNQQKTPDALAYASFARDQARRDAGENVITRVVNSTNGSRRDLNATANDAARARWGLGANATVADVDRARKADVDAQRGQRLLDYAAKTQGMPGYAAELTRQGKPIPGSLMAMMTGRDPQAEQAQARQQAGMGAMQALALAAKNGAPVDPDMWQQAMAMANGGQPANPQADPGDVAAHAMAQAAAVDQPRKDRALAFRKTKNYPAAAAALGLRGDAAQAWATQARSEDDIAAANANDPGFVSSTWHWMMGSPSRPARTTKPAAPVAASRMRFGPNT